MSVQTLAQNLAASGRNNDSMLVHMTPSEVGGLQALAMAHGGSLTINPKTGLPEAGILESILPTILGVVLTPFLGPIGAGLAVGGGTALATGDIGKGLAAGLGAWGGGGLGEAMGAAGAASGAGANVAAGTLPTAAASTAEKALYGSMTDVATASGADAIKQAGLNAARDAAAYNAALPATAQFSNMGAGLGALGDQASRNVFMGNIGGAGGLMKSTLAAAAPAALQPPEPIKLSEEEESNYAGPYYPTERKVTYAPAGYNPSREWSYFSPSNPRPFASGGKVDKSLVALRKMLREDERKQPSHADKEAKLNDDLAHAVFLQDMDEMAKSFEGDWVYRDLQKLREAERAEPGYEERRAERGLPPTSHDWGAETWLYPKDSPVAEAPPDAAKLAEAARQAALSKYPSAIQWLIKQNSYADGGDVGEDRSVKAAPVGYSAGMEDEFNHNFRPVVDATTPSSAPATIGGKGALRMENPVVGYVDGKPVTKYASDGSHFSTGNPFADMMAAVLGFARPTTSKVSGSLSSAKYDPETQKINRYAAGRFLQGHGDGASDSIPATISGGQPARLADGEFVIDARSVSEIGNGSSNAGAKKLYAMLDRVHSARKSAKRGQDSNADRYLPA